MNNSLVALAVLLMCCGCASTYKPLVPSTLKYQPQTQTDQVRISLVPNAQYISGNLRYSKKEYRHEMRSIALKIENFSNDTIEITRDNLKVESLKGRKVIIDATDYSKFVKQRVGAHLLHALYGPWAISWHEDSSGEVDVDFIYIPVGALIGIGNAVRASNANKQNLATQKQFQLLNKVLLPGETVYGLLIVNAVANEEVSISLDH